MKTPKSVKQLELAVREHVLNSLVQNGLTHEFAEWLFDGIGDDAKNDWSEKQFFEWVDYGKIKYGFKVEHHQLVNKITKEVTQSLISSRRRNHN